MHPNNRHKNGYDFTQLVIACPALANYVVKQPGKRPTINFSDADAVKILNQALLKHHYNVQFWDIPTGYLCPPVPGRADYIHHIADLLSHSTGLTQTVRGLDVGVGANAIYPIIGSQIYDWHFVGSDIAPKSVECAQQIVATNPNLQSHITIRQQTQRDNIFKGIILPNDYFSFTMCNPPFHASAHEASTGSQRKNRNLALNKQKRHGSKVTLDKTTKTHLNFAGQHNELWCTGGELAFIKKMIDESQHFAAQVQWFTTLVSKKDNLAAIYKHLHRLPTSDVKTINMGQGNKISRFVAWQFKQ